MPLMTVHFLLRWIDLKDCCAPSVVFKPFVLTNVKAHFSSLVRGLVLTTSWIACAVVFVCSVMLKSWDGFESKEFSPCGFTSWNKLGKLCCGEKRAMSGLSRTGDSALTLMLRKGFSFGEGEICGSCFIYAEWIIEVMMISFSSFFLSFSYLNIWKNNHKHYLP